MKALVIIFLIILGIITLVALASELGGWAIIAIIVIAILVFSGTVFKDK